MAQVIREYIKKLPSPKILLAIGAIAEIAVLSFPMLSAAGWGLTRLRSIAGGFPTAVRRKILV